MELVGTEEQPVIVSSSEDSTPSDGSKIIIDDKEQETENESSSEISSEEEEEMLRKIRKQKSDKAKAIMRYGADLKHWRPEELASGSRSSPSTVQTKRKYHVLRSEDGQKEHNIIPPSIDNESQSISNEQDVLPNRNPGGLAG